MRVGDELRLDVDVLEAAVMLRPVAEPPDRPYEVALIRDPGHRRDEQLVGENNARGGQHRQIQFSALAHFLVGQAPGLRGTLLSRS